MKKYIFPIIIGLIIANAAAASFWGDLMGFFEPRFGAPSYSYIPNASTTNLSVANKLYLGTATTTGTNGLDISGGCFAVNGTCLGVGSGTVTSVAMTVPTGLTITGSPITTSGTLALGLDTGYVIASTTRLNQHDTAYSWGNHALGGYLSASAYYATTTHPYISSLPSLSITKSQVSDFGTYENPLTFSYPLLRNTNAISLAYGTTTSNTWAGTQTFTNAPVLTSLGTPAGTFLAVNGTGLIIATTTPSGGSGTVGTGTTGQFPYYAANGTTLTATSSLLINSAGKLTIGTTISNNFFDWGTAYSAIIDTKDTATNGLILLSNRNSSTIRSSGELTLVNENQTNNNLSEIHFALRDVVGDVRVISGISATYTNHQNAGPAGGLRFWTRNNSFVDALTIDPSGLVGINDITPSYWLDVNGAGRFTSYVDAAYFVATSSTATSTISSGLSILSAIEFYTSKVIKLLSGAIADFTGGTTKLGTTTITDGSVTGNITPYTYPSIIFASSTPMTATSTFRIRTAPVNETWKQAICYCDSGTALVQFYNGTAKLNLISVSTTPATTTLSTNNAFLAGVNISADVGSPVSSPTQVICVPKVYRP